MSAVPATSEIVATFELRDGLQDPCAMVVRHDSATGRWLVELPCRIVVPVEPTALEGFALALLDAVAWRPSEGRRRRETDHALFGDDDLDVVVTVEAREEGLCLVVIAMTSIRRDRDGTPLPQPVGAMLGEFTADPADAAAVSAAAQRLLGRLRPSR